MSEPSEEMLRQFKDLAEKMGIDLGVQGEEKPGRPTGVTVDLGGALIGLAEELGGMLSDKGLYRFRKDFVTVDEGDRKEMMPVMSPEAFCSWIQEFVSLQKWDKKEKEMVAANMNEALAKKVMASHRFRNRIPRIKAVLSARMPVWRDGELVLLDEGYNEVEEIYVSSIAPELKELSLEEALAEWQEVFGEFPLDGMRSKAAHTAAAVGLFCQYMFPDACAVPLFQYNANMEGAGKSLMGRSVVIPIYTLDGYGDTDYNESDKFKEELNSIAHSGKGYLFLDDISGNLFSPVLNRWVT